MPLELQEHRAELLKKAPRRIPEAGDPPANLPNMVNQRPALCSVADAAAWCACSGVPPLLAASANRATRRCPLDSEPSDSMRVALGCLPPRSAGPLKGAGPLLCQPAAHPPASHLQMFTPQPHTSCFTPPIPTPASHQDQEERWTGSFLVCFRAGLLGGWGRCRHRRLRAPRLAHATGWARCRRAGGHTINTVYHGSVADGRGGDQFNRTECRRAGAAAARTGRRRGPGGCPHATGREQRGATAITTCTSSFLVFREWTLKSTQSLA